MAKKAPAPNVQPSIPRYTGSYGEVRQALSSLSPAQKQSVLSNAAMMALPARASIGSAFADALASISADQLAENMERNRQLGGEFLPTWRRGGKVKSSKMHKAPKANRYARGGSVQSSASKRADGIAKKGKTRGRFV